MNPTTPLKLYVTTVIAVAIVAAVTLPGDVIGSDPYALLVLAALASMASARPIRFLGQGSEATPTHPLILCALAGLGPMDAIVVAMVGVATAVSFRLRKPPGLRTLFNFANVLAATAVAAHLFRWVGGSVGTDGSYLPWALPIATIGYFLVNTGLVIGAISLEKGVPLLRVWRRSFRWTVASYLSGLTFAIGMLVALERFGPAGLALGLPAVWMLVGFYTAHHSRIREREKRLTEVEQLNVSLERKVEELQQALDEVQELRGLLPICMHCKSIRDDDNSWHKVEEYIAKHSEASFTHSCCDHCRETHYDIPVRCESD